MAFLPETSRGMSSSYCERAENHGLDPRIGFHILYSCVKSPSPAWNRSSPRLSQNGEHQDGLSA